MSILKLQLEDAELRKTPSKEMAAEVNETKFFRDSGFYYAGTTDYSDFSVFEILEDFLQPGTETSLGAAAESILKITPDKAPLSEEVTNVGRVVLELAEQIPYYHPSHIKLARVMELLTSSPKFINESPYVSRLGR